MQEELENLNIPITKEKMESAAKTLQQRKVQDQMPSLVNSTKYLRVYPNSSHTLPKFREGNIFMKSAFP